MTGADDIQFIDNALPPLPAGDYTLEVRQAIELPPHYAPPAPYETIRRMRVAGPHFTLAPGDVAAFIPAANSVAAYEHVLPAAVLAQSGLPWQISLGGARSGPLVAPWMAVLLLLPEEILAPAGEGGAAALAGSFTVPLAAYLEPPSGCFGPQFSAQEKAAFLRQYDKLSVAVVDVAAGAFAAIAPSLEDLPYLAHARDVDIEHQVIDEGQEPGRVAVVLGNRLPMGSASGLYLAHLVSLEGFASVLPGGAALPAGTAAVRLVSLASWVFTSLGQSSDFAGTMAGLDAGTLRLPEPPPAVARRASGTPDTTIREALALGYTAMRYATRLGEETTGWYRGPCLPVPMMRNAQPPFGAAEAGLIYDWDRPQRTSDGLFDLSFAVAWQTGRLAALADRQFVTALLAWVRETNDLARLLAERLDWLRRYPGIAAVNDAGQLLAPDLLRHRAFRLLADGLAPLLAPPDPRLQGDAAAVLARPWPLFGPPRDPTGILAQLPRYPGVVPPGVLLDRLAAGDDVFAAPQSGTAAS